MSRGIVLITGLGVGVMGTGGTGRVGAGFRVGAVCFERKGTGEGDTESTHVASEESPLEAIVSEELV